MAEICCGVVSKQEAAEPCEPSSRAARRRRMLLRRIKSVDGASTVGLLVPSLTKRQKVEPSPFFPTSELQCGSAIESAAADEEKNLEGDEREKPLRGSNSLQMRSAVSNRRPSFGFTSLCGRRRDMEDAVSFHPFFSAHDRQDAPALHFFGVFDGHGCSHVAKICKDRMHGLVAEELGRGDVEWEEVMKRSFSRMDKEVAGAGNATPAAKCRCELQTPRCDAVGSTAVVAVVSPAKIVVANCGDSRAVLCRSGKPVPLSSDHKPDRPDELQRIEAAGGRVIFWDGPRVLGVLAMSRAIGDSYLKPYVSSLPEVTVTDRSFADDCLILASDGLWDVVSNDTACDVARMCLRGQASGTPAADGEIAERDGRSDKACSDAATLLTKLALARRSADNVSVIVVDLRMYT